VKRTRFLTQVRQYAALAQRMHRSFAPQILDIDAGWNAQVEGSDLTPAEKAQQMAWGRGVIDREYAPNDPDFHWQDDAEQPAAEEPEFPF